MDSTKHVVLPLPLWDWAMRSLCGGCRIMGSVMAWILLGRSNFISTYSPFISSALMGSSSNVCADW